MNKTKVSMNKIGKYLRELSIVVLGVAITLSVTIWINKGDEKRDMTLYLNAIKIEMEENITIVDNAREYLQYEAKYEEYLSSHDNQSLNDDTLGYYVVYCCYQLQKVDLSTNAFEMLKSSGVMRLMDKDLLLLIWKSYQKFITLNDFFYSYYERKFEHIEREAILIKNGELNLEDLKYAKHAPMYNFYAVSLAGAILQNWEENVEFVKEVLSKLDNNR